MAKRRTRKPRTTTNGGATTVDLPADLQARVDSALEGAVATVELGTALQTETADSEPDLRDPSVDQARRWEGIIALLDQQSSDGRILAAGGLQPRDLPLSLMAMFGGGAHGIVDPVLVGAIDQLRVAADELHAGGWFDYTTDGDRALQAMTDGSLTGISVDTIPIEYEIVDNRPEDQQGDMLDPEDSEHEIPTDHEGRPIIEQGRLDDFILTMTEWELTGACLVANPAFAPARIGPVTASGVPAVRLVGQAGLAGFSATRTPSESILALYVDGPDSASLPLAVFDSDADPLVIAEPLAGLLDPIEAGDAAGMMRAALAVRDALELAGINATVLIPSLSEQASGQTFRVLGCETGDQWDGFDLGQSQPEADPFVQVNGHYDSTMTSTADGPMTLAMLREHGVTSIDIAPPEPPEPVTAAIEPAMLEVQEAGPDPALLAVAAALTELSQRIAQGEDRHSELLGALAALQDRRPPALEVVRDKEGRAVRYVPMTTEPEE